MNPRLWQCLSALFLIGLSGCCCVIGGGGGGPAPVQETSALRQSSPPERQVRTPAEPAGDARSAQR